MNTNYKTVLKGVLGIGSIAAAVAILLSGRHNYDEEGYNKNGYDRSGYDRNGYDIDGYDKNGYDINGYDENGYNKYLYNSKGIDVVGKTYHDYIMISEDLEKRSIEIKEYLSDQKFENAIYLMKRGLNEFIQCFLAREHYRETNDKSDGYRTAVKKEGFERMFEYSLDRGTPPTFWTYELSTDELDGINHAVRLSRQKGIRKSQFWFISNEFDKLPNIMKKKLKNISETISTNVYE